MRLSIALRPVLLALALIAPRPLAAQAPDSTLHVPAAARSSAGFDPALATDAWLASVPPADAARSDAYFEGGYWLLLWNALSAGIYVLLLASGASARMRDVAERVTRFRAVHVWTYWAQLTVVTAVLAFPLTVYQGFLSASRARTGSRHRRCTWWTRRARAPA